MDQDGDSTSHTHAFSSAVFALPGIGATLKHCQGAEMNSWVVRALVEQDIVYTKWNWVRECLALNESFSWNKEETKEETAIQKLSGVSLEHGMCY